MTGKRSPIIWLIRYLFDRGAAKTSLALDKHVPKGVSSMLNQRYDDASEDTYFDVYFPSSIVNTDKVLPAVVWVHGGAWVSGDKNDVANYAKIIASHNFVVISVGYSIAPKQRYPTPVMQLSSALAYVQQHAQYLHVDRNRIALAGDSAGAQIVAQMAAIVTNTEYAKKNNIASPLQPKQLRAMLLNCGAYDINLPNYSSIGGWLFLKPVLRAYSGVRDFLQYQPFALFSVQNFVTKNFPPSFITAGNADPLLLQSTEFAHRLALLGVKTETLFFAKNHRPALQHEYQFNLDLDDGQKALHHMLGFLKTNLH